MRTTWILSLFLELMIVCTCSDASEQLPDVFLGFFPCVPGSVNMSTQEDAQRCDLFVYAAVQLALVKLKNEIVQKISLDPVVTKDFNNSEVSDNLVNLYTQVVSERSEKFHRTLELTQAAVGSDNNYVTGLSVVSLATHFDLPIVSYGLTEERFNDYALFYRTLPSLKTLNQALLKLLAHFNWRRIGVLSSSQVQYSHQARRFSTEIKDSSILSYMGSTSDSMLNKTLREIYRRDIRIIIGFFGAKEARMVLCEASSEKYRLTTSDHVWILPSYYNPDWWKGGGQGVSQQNLTKICTDEEMASILNSVIFLDPVKYPPMDTPLSRFYPTLLNKTRELFTQLGPQVELEPLLQHSRAVSAYDSTLLLAHSLTEGWINTSRIDSQLVCELCKIHSVTNNFPLCNKVLQICENSTVHSNIIEISKENVRNTILTAYGQVLITQFINGTHCPMVLFWSSESNDSKENKGSFVPISKLSEFSGELKLHPNILFPNAAACSQDFYWKGRNSPPESNYVQTSEIPEWALVFVGVVTGLTEVLIIFLIVFSIVWRENSHVRSSSPRVNVLILIGAGLRISYSLMDGITSSASRYDLQSKDGTVLCQFTLWIHEIGNAVFFSGLLVKTIRLYRIFNNKKMKVTMKCLHDWELILFMLALLVPILLILIIWTSVKPIMLIVEDEPNKKSQYVHVTYCSVEDYDFHTIFDLALIRTYLTLVYLTAVILSFFVTGTPEIKLDLSMLRLALGIRTVTLLLAYTITNIDDLTNEAWWWFFAVDAVFGTAAVLCVLFLYQVILVALDYRSKVISKMSSKMCQTQQNKEYYWTLLKEIKELSNSLSEKEAAIKNLKRTAVV